MADLAAAHDARPTTVPTPYEDLLRHVLTTGTPKADRTGTGTRSVFGHQMRFDLSAGFPLVTTKRVFFRGVAEELFWFLRGESNIASLVAKDVHIWDEWADADGELGPVYGVQWRSWPPPAGGVPEPVRFLHRTLIGSFGMLLGELWHLADLVADCRADGRHEGMLTSAPLHAPGGIGSTANALVLK